MPILLMKPWNVGLIRLLRCIRHFDICLQFISVTTCVVMLCMYMVAGMLTSNIRRRIGSRFLNNWIDLLHLALAIPRLGLKGSLGSGEVWSLK